MAFKDIWRDKTDGVDDVLAEDTNSIAHAVIENEDNIKQLGVSVNIGNKRITNLEKRIVPDPFQTDDSTVYEKTVPANACPYAQIDKVGTMGVPVISGNLASNIDTDAGDWTMDINDILTIDGTITPDNYIDIQDIPDLPIGTTLVMDVAQGFEAFVDCYAEYEDEEGNTYGGQYQFYFENGEATLYDDEFKRMVEAGYEGGVSVAYIKLVPLETMTNPSFRLDLRIKTEKVTALEMQGANIIKFPYKYAVGEPYTSNGLTYTVLEDGGIRVVGVPTKSFTYEINAKDALSDLFVPNQAYTLSGCQPGIIVGVRRTNDSTGASSIWLESSVTVNPTPRATWADGYTANALYLYNGSSSVGAYIDTVIYPVLNEGSSAYPYGKYCRGTHTLWEIPEELQAREDYGKEGAYIDLERKVLLYGENETDISAYLPDDNLFEIEGAKSIIVANKGNNPVSSSITYMLKES